MCGIVGLLRFRGPIEKSEISEAVTRLAHRGPDGDGLLAAENVVIGHRRLSIIDPEMGKQPMSNDDGSIWITFNGEIYNFRELRQTLESDNHVFRTHSDTEVIIHAYEKWGDNCVNHLRGMFAFAIVDFARRRVFLARDQFGIKPLFYFWNHECFVFGSEIQALKAFPDIPLDIDLQALDQYLWLQYIPAPRSIFRQIRKLPPAHRMSITFDGTLDGPHEYWDIQFRPGSQRSEEDWLAELEHVISESVKAHLVSDVPFGAFLSGGVDSSAVVTYMAQLLDRPIKTFSIGFRASEFDESRYASLVAERWGTEHHTEILEPDALGVLPELVRHSGEPFGDSSIIPMFYVSKLAREHVPMVLSGDGSDELFAGYQSYLEWMGHLYPQSRLPSWKRRLYPLASRILPRRYPPISPRRDHVDNWLSLVNYMSRDLRAGLWREEFKHVLSCPLDVFETMYSRTSHCSDIQKVQYMDLKTYLPYDILSKVDIASMANSLEVRTPFVDKRVVEFAATIPASLNMALGSDGRWQGKLLLKKMLEKYYPKAFLYRRKQGFSIPLETWFFNESGIKGDVKERLFSQNSGLRTYFDTKGIQALIDNRFVGPLWLLLVLDEWMDQSRRDRCH
jgi:asparagine synthase (glutamine-hydrolysing)